MDDRRLGRAVRALRVRLKLRQLDLAVRAARSQDVISRIERGRLEGVSLRTLRSVVAALDADLVVLVRWRGGDLDRLLDAGHAAMGSEVAERLSRWGWAVEPEVSYSEFGERGSVDLLAWHPMERILLVIEIKTELTSIEETLRKHDAKVRLGPDVSRKRFGWSPSAVARVLVLPERTIARDRVAAHRALFARSYPLRGVHLRTWLQQPMLGGAPRGGLWFLRPSDQMRRTGRQAGLKRVRVPGTVTRQPHARSERAGMSVDSGA